MSESFLQEIADQLRNQNPPADPTPVDPAPVDPTPVDPTPADPAPVNPTPVEPTPVDPAPADPEPKVKEWWEEDPKPADPAPADPTPKPNKEENPVVELDEDLKLLAEYKKSGKTLADFVKEYQVEDYKSWNDEKIVKEGLKEFMNLTDEELEQANYEFESASILQKKQWAETFRGRFEQKNEEKLKQLTTSNVQQSEFQKAIADKYNADLEQFSKQIVNQEMFGIKITDEMSKDLKTFIDTEFTLQKEDGSFDIEKMYSIGLWLKYGKDLVKANITKARNEGKEQVIKEVTNPSKNMTGGGRAVGSGLEAAQEAFNTLFPG